MDKEELKEMSDWKVDLIFQMVNGHYRRAYEVNRKIDPNGPNYGENLQSAGAFKKKSEALAEAKRLNEEELRREVE